MLFYCRWTFLNHLSLVVSNEKFFQNNGAHAHYSRTITIILTRPGWVSSHINWLDASELLDIELFSGETGLSNASVNFADTVNSLTL